MAIITLHLTAADGAVFDLPVTLPAVKPPATVRLSMVTASPVAASAAWDGKKWVPAP